MTPADIIAALALPPESRVDRRVPKTLLVENGAPTAADKRQINEGIDELLWLAALKPSNIGVPAYRDPVREALEIAVLSLVLKPGAKAHRLTELIHRAIPYPVLLVATQEGAVTLSVAGKRLALNEAGVTVLDDAVVACTLAAQPHVPALLASLSLAALPRTHLLALYQGWINCLEAFLSAEWTGRFEPAVSPEGAAVRRAALADHARLSREITQLRAQAEKQSQVNRLVEINLAVKRREAELARALKEM
jgi:hypothetical protein